jgi:hypothetical protein
VDISSNGAFFKSFGSLRSRSRRLTVCKANYKTGGNLGDKI